MNTTTIRGCNYFDYTPYEGYAWLERQANSIHGALHAIPEYGEWPYSIAVAGARENRFVIKTYCEHDEQTWTYADNERDEYTAHLKQLRKATQ